MGGWQQHPQGIREGDDLTTRQAIYEVLGLRPSGLSDKQIDSWEKRLREFDPQDIVAAGNRVAYEWKFSSGWPIGELLRHLEEAPNPSISSTGFFWDVFTGLAYGNWEVFQKLPSEERRGIAEALLRFKGAGDLYHEQTAEQMYPGIVALKTNPYEEDIQT